MDNNVAGNIIIYLIMITTTIVIFKFATNPNRSAPEKIISWFFAVGQFLTFIGFLKYLWAGALVWAMACWFVSDNPILTREMRRRMRGKAMIYSLIGYVGVLCVVTFFLLVTSQLQEYAFNAGTGPNSIKMQELMNETGSRIYLSMATIQAVLVLILAPAITASLITAERERQTADFLRVTTLPPSHFVVGSFLSTIMYVSLLLGCALPIVSVSMLFGGLSLNQVFIMFGALFVSSVLLSSLGIYTSSVNQRTRTAQGVMLAVAIVFVIASINFSNLLDWWLPFVQRNPALFGQGVTPIFGLTVPDMLFSAFPPLFLSWITLTIASRKVYDEDNRPLSYTQFTAIALIALLTVIAMFWTRNSANELYLAQGAWFTMVFFIFLAAAMIMTIHQVEVGSENWKLHQKIPALAVLDDSILYVALLMLGVLGMGQWFFSVAAPQSPEWAANHAIVLIAMIPSFLFCATLGRYIATKVYRRQHVFRIHLGIILVLWLILPTVIMIAYGFDFTDLDPVGGLFVDVSPLFALIHIVALDLPNNDGGSLSAIGAWPGYIHAVVYLAITAVLYLQVARRNARWKAELKAIEEAAYVPGEFRDGVFVYRQGEPTRAPA